ncbi:MAG: hypothetical protein FJX47_10000 [Alphaproteobacteria bacterium]|nr:hypothetical protein [Alphaproteobacteria bacterium]
MLRLTTFIALLCGLMVALALARDAVLSIDAFAEIGEEPAAAFHALPPTLQTRVKFHHIERAPRYDVMLLGNSRAAAVQSRDIELGGRSFFNLSIGGRYFRDQTAFFGELSALGKMPKVALIAVDRFDLYNDDEPIWPPYPRRWLVFGRDWLGCAAARACDAEDLATMMFRELRNSFREFRALLNFELLAAAWRLHVAAKSPAGRTKFDIEAGLPKDDPIDANNPHFGLGRHIVKGLFVADLEDIAKLSAAVGDVRVILFEMPILPAYHRILAETPYRDAPELRRLFLATCGRLRLECHPTEYVPPDQARRGWADTTHPFGDVLGPYVSRFLNAPGKP